MVNFRSSFPISSGRNNATLLDCLIIVYGLDYLVLLFFKHILLSLMFIMLTQYKLRLYGLSMVSTLKEGRFLSELEFVIFYYKLFAISSGRTTKPVLCLVIIIQSSVS